MLKLLCEHLKLFILSNCELKKFIKLNNCFKISKILSLFSVIEAYYNKISYKNLCLDWGSAFKIENFLVDICSLNYYYTYLNEKFSLWNKDSYWLCLDCTAE